MSLRVLDSLAGVAAADWDRLAGDHPLLRHAFLHALHETGCACEETGWAPRYLTLWEQERLTGAMPLYLKSHSYGEYVFDWAWAEAYQRHGLHYYPKLLSAVPFTPATGPRVLAADAQQRRALVEAALHLARESEVSSLHLLFPPQELAGELEAGGLMLRASVQFHWRNPGWSGFEDYLEALTHDKRKKIRQERRRVREAGVVFQWLNGHQATEEHWDFFVRCYNRTYRQHHSTPYLNREFFLQLARTMPDEVLLVVGSRGGKPIAVALNIHNRHTLYGRYWGATEFHSGLHFETCYYQAIEFCIARGISLFEGGAQGEHKLARGFLPVETISAHWLARPEFSRAVEQFLQREQRGIGAYVGELNEHSPFRAGGDADVQSAG